MGTFSFNLPENIHWSGMVGNGSAASPVFNRGWPASYGFETTSEPPQYAIVDVTFSGKNRSLKGVGPLTAEQYTDVMYGQQDALPDPGHLTAALNETNADYVVAEQHGIPDYYAESAIARLAELVLKN